MDNKLYDEYNTKEGSNVLFVPKSEKACRETHNIFLKFTGTFLGEIGDQNMVT